MKSLNSAINIAERNRIITFGIIPSSAETGFGYIESFQNLDLKTFEGREIKRFIEKPEKKIAESYLKDNRYSWNSGMFVFKSSVIKGVRNLCARNNRMLQKFLKQFCK